MNRDLRPNRASDKKVEENRPPFFWKIMGVCFLQLLILTLLRPQIAIGRPEGPTKVICVLLWNSKSVLLWVHVKTNYTLKTQLVAHIFVNSRSLKGCDGQSSVFFVNSAEIYKKWSKRAKNCSDDKMCITYFKCVWLLNSRKTTFVGPW